METLLNNLTFLAKYDYLFLIAISALMLVILYVLLSLNKENTHHFNRIFNQSKDTILAIEETESDIREHFAKNARNLQQISEFVRKNIKEGIHEMNTSVLETHANERAPLEAVATQVTAITAGNSKLEALLEKQGVFLHDNFGDLVASNKNVQQEIQHSLSGAVNEQSRRIEQLQQLLQEQTNKSSESVEAIRDAVTSQLVELMMKERALQQETQSQMTQLIGGSIDRLTNEMDAKLTMVTDKVSNRFNENLASTMQSFHNLQQQIDALIAAKNDIDSLGQDVSSLARMMLQKDSGGITQGHLPDMLAAMLPDDAYILNPVIEGHSAAAQLMLPGDRGAVVVDNNFSLENFDDILTGDVEQARATFNNSLIQHINTVADNFIKPPVTGNSALLFVASETAFAEIQAHHRNAVNLAAERQVWMVSPTTLAAALNMARSALKDQKARGQLEQMRVALQQVVQEAQQFENRLLEIGDHVNNAMRSVQRAESAGAKLFGDVRDVAHIADERQPAAKPAALPETQQSL
ncbi:MAG: DNA recombination protein RmuC [Proteobacteria bacterium]|nr:DNA recombination protein RmuC [Pseudomonadota bacterium]